jgi:hypothetical protein
MKRQLLSLSLLASLCLAGQTAAWAGQAPGAASDQDIPVSHRDRVYSAEQFSNTVSNGEGALEPLAAFMTNPAGSAIVNATGAIRQVVHGEDSIRRRYLVIAKGHPDKPGPVVQMQLK